MATTSASAGDSTRSGLPVRRMPESQAMLWAGLAYAGLVIVMWGTVSLHSGLPGETAFPYNSETHSWLDGFFYHPDPLRIHTNTFYHLSYLLGELFGVGGSYVPYQLVYAFLWWARGMLVFLILCKMLPNCLTVCYVAGALVLAHTTDGAVGFVGQLNQFGFIFWMLLAFYLLTLALETPNRRLSVLLTIAACFFEYMSLWSYESQILLLIAFPLVLLLRHGRAWRRVAVPSAPWYSITAIYLAKTVLRYALAGGGAYQKSVLRGDWGMASLMADWGFNIAASLEFWNWRREGWGMPPNEAIPLSLLASVVFVAGALMVARRAQRNEGPGVFGSTVGTWSALLAVGFVLLALSFPIYLLLKTVRMLWRTQILAGLGAGLVFTALAGLVPAVLRPRALRTIAFLAVGSAVVFFGTLSAIEKGTFHHLVWQRHRTAILKILRVAPSVKPNTVIVLTNVPRNDDPFQHTMWLDLPLRLVYPGIQVAGVYFYADGTPSPGNNIKADGDRWKWDETGSRPLVRDTSIANTVVVDFDPAGKGRLEKTMPPYVCQGNCNTGLYNPEAVITGPVSPRAVRRYQMDRNP